MKKKTIEKKELMEHYSDYLLTEGNPPVNVYQFTKKLGISEDPFYRYFTSLSLWKVSTWCTSFSNPLNW